MFCLNSTAFKKTWLTLLSIVFLLLPKYSCWAASDVFTLLQVKNYTQGTGLSQTINADPGDTVMFQLYMNNYWPDTITNLRVSFSPSPVTGGLIYPSGNTGGYYAYHYNNSGNGVTGYIPLTDLDLDGSSGGDGEYLMTTSLLNGGIDQMTYIFVEIPADFAASTFTLTATAVCDGVCNDASSGENIATVNVDVAPQVSDVTFMPESIPRDGITPTAVTATVSDPNTPNDITSVTIDLTSVGGGAAVVMFDDGSHDDGIALDGVFGATGITVNNTVAAGTYDSLSVTATDGDGNLWTADGSLIIVKEGEPTVSVNSITREVLSEETGYTSTTINWQSNQDCGSGVNQGFQVETSTGGVLIPWNTSCVSNVAQDIVLTKDDILEGTEELTLRMINDNGGGYALFTLEKDLTSTIPYVAEYSGVVGTQDGTLKWKAGENGTYTVRVGGNGLNPLSGTEITGNNANGTYTDDNVTNGDIVFSVISNSDLSLWSNNVYIFLTDDGGNVGIKGVTIIKNPPPKLDGVTSPALVDNDTTEESLLNGQDFTVTWTKPTDSDTVNNFARYDIYLLPEATTLDTLTHNPVTAIDELTDVNTETWTGTGGLVIDSNGDTLVAANYKAYVVTVTSDTINFDNSDPAATAAATIITEPLIPPAFVSATFISDTSVEVTFSRNLDTNLAAHDASLFTSTDFTIDGTAGTNGVLSISGAVITLGLNSLNNTGQTSTDLDIAAGAVVSVSGAAVVETLDQTVADGQNPVITFTAPIADSFLNDTISVQYQLSEGAKSNGVTLTFTQTGGEADANSPHTATLSGETGNTPYDLSFNANNFTSLENGAGDALVNGAQYSIAINATDVADNIATPITRAGGYFDNELPATPVTVHFPSAVGINGQYTNDLTPQLNWFSSTDNLTSGDDLVYTLELALISDFSVLEQDYTDINLTIDVTNDTYAVYLEEGTINSGGGSFYVMFKMPGAENIKRIKIPFLEFDPNLITINTTDVTAIEPVVATWTDPAIADGVAIVDLANKKYIDFETGRNGLAAENYLIGGALPKQIFKIDFTVNPGQNLPVLVDLFNTGGVEIVDISGTNRVGDFTWYRELLLQEDGAADANAQELLSLTTNGTYFWRVKAVDQANNSSNWQAITEEFVFDNTDPTINTINLIDSTLGSVTYTTDGDIVNLSALISDANNADMTIADITADLSGFGGGAAVNPLTYNTGTGLATWSGALVTCADGSVSITITATDPADNTTTDNSASLICDNTDPVVATTTITSPNGGDFWAGNSSQLITWNTGDITETNLTGLTLEYFDGSAWQQIATSEANDGSYTWDPVPSLDINNVQIRLTAVDGTNKTASDTSDADFTIDSTQPAITANTVTYPNGGEYIKGGSDVTITWNDADITDTNLKATPIKLEYFDGSSWQLIADNISNSGSYLRSSVPSLNINNALIRLTAVDKAVNYDLDDSDAGFTIDSIAPTINLREILDLNGNGLLDAVKIELDENINDATINLGDFSLSENYTWDAFSGSRGAVTFSSGIGTVTADDNTFYLAITEGSGDNAEAANCSGLSVTGCDTAQTPTLQYTAGNLQDLAGNNLVSDAGVVVTDKAAPVAKYGHYLDDNSDGQIDRVDFYFSEDVISDGYEDGDYVIPDGGDINLVDEASVTAVNETLRIFTNGDAKITGWSVAPQVSYTNNFVEGSRGLNDASGNVTASFSLPVMDQAAPIFWVETWIATVTPSVKISFSENVDSTADSFAVWTLTNGFNATAIDTLDGTTSFALLSVDQNFVDTSVIPDVTYTAGDIRDNSFNNLSTNTVTSSDKLAPYVNTIAIEDSNANGSVDLARIDFSEDIDLATVNLSDYTIGGIIPTAKNVSTNQLELTITNEIRETKAVEVVYTGSTTADSLGNEIDAIEMGDAIEIDSAGPAILSAFYIEGATVADDELIVVFSEDVDDSTIVLADFAVAGGGAITNATVNGATPNDNRISIELNAGDTRLTVGSSTIAFVGSGVVSDNIDDGDGKTTNTQTSGVVVNGAIVINEVMWSGTSSSSSDEYIELRNLGASAVDISGWVIENAASGGGSLTIPAAQTITSNGYYLISNYNENDASSQLNVTPDWVTTSVSLTNTGNGNLVLKDDIGTTLDSAKGDTWPAGDSVNKYSMERKEDIGDGLSASSWYTAVESTNLDAGIEKGTPKAVNVFDNLPPEITLASRTPTPNSLLPMTTPVISVDYAENVGGVGVDTNSVKIEVDLNQDDDFDDEVLLGGVTYRESPDIVSLNPVFCNNGGSMTVTTTNAQCTPPTSLPVGKNLVKVTVSDLASNETNSSWNFWLDSLTMTVTEQNAASMSVSAGGSDEVNDSTKITVQTYGAGLGLQAVFAQLTTGGQNIDFTEYSYDVRVAGSATQAYDGYSNASVSESVWSIAKEADLASNPGLKTYEVYIKYQVDIDAIQAAGSYGGDVDYGLDVTY